MGLWVAVVGVLLTGCAREPRFGESGEPLAVTALTELPPPTGTDLVQSAQPYLIGPFDKLTVSVFGAAELSGDVQADAQGRISVPLIGAVDAAGQTPAQLASIIQDRLRGRYLRDPNVTVNLKEATSQTVTVDGQVTEPGIYPAIGNMSLMRAVAAAKGANEYARLDDVVVFRTVEGKPMAALYNLGAIRRGLYADPRIYANDVVVVGDSKARRLFKDVLAIAPALVTPLVLLLQ
jgi:polysaccharide export outer membrane protein